MKPCSPFGQQPGFFINIGAHTCFRFGDLRTQYDRSFSVVGYGLSFVSSTRLLCYVLRARVGAVISLWMVHNFEGYYISAASENTNRQTGRPSTEDDLVVWGCLLMLIS